MGTCQNTKLGEKGISLQFWQARSSSPSSLPYFNTISSSGKTTKTENKWGMTAATENILKQLLFLCLSYLLPPFIHSSFAKVRAHLQALLIMEVRGFWKTDTTYILTAPRQQGNLLLNPCCSYIAYFLYASLKYLVKWSWQEVLNWKPRVCHCTFMMHLYSIFNHQQQGTFIY